MHEKLSIALIGMRGSGKSVVGRELAALRGGICVDTDDLIVAAAGQTIAAIFQNEGEAGFRLREAEAVAKAVAMKPAAISVGGGAVLDARNIDALRSAATIVWLTAPAEVLWQRIETDATAKATRPALTEERGLKEIQTVLAKRTKPYEKAADLVVDTKDKTPRYVAEEIMNLISWY